MNRSETTKEILQRAHRRLKASSRSGSSLRALAPKVGVSHVFLSKVLNGKAALPKRLVAKVSGAFQLDAADKHALKNSLILEQFGEFGDLSAQASAKTVFSGYVDLPERYFKYFADWRCFATLDLLTCEMPFAHTRATIQAQIPFTDRELSTFLKVMLDLKLIKEKSGILAKTDRKLRIPARGANPHSKSLYSSIARLTEAQLQKTKVEDYEKRLVMGFSCAVNPKNLERARIHMIQAIKECAEILSEGECTDVHWVQGQFFSLLK